MKYTVIALGKLKEKYWTHAVNEYEKRLKGSLEIIELTPQRLSENPTENEINTALLKEAEQIKAKIPKSAFVFALCIEGKMFSSEDFTEKINTIVANGKSHICFIIGSSYGLSEELKKAADERLSMSRMTFTHKLARVMLIEQIYRAVSINNNSKYHK